MTYEQKMDSFDGKPEEDSSLLDLKIHPAEFELAFEWFKAHPECTKKEAFEKCLNLPTENQPNVLIWLKCHTLGLPFLQRMLIPELDYELLMKYNPDVNIDDSGEVYKSPNGGLIPFRKLCTSFTKVTAAKEYYLKHKRVEQHFEGPTNLYSVAYSLREKYAPETIGMSQAQMDILRNPPDEDIVAAIDEIGLNWIPPAN